MKTIEIIGFKRANLTKGQLQDQRMEGLIPCVLYGGGINEQFFAPAALFRDLVYTDKACFVELNIEGKKFKAIKQDIQFHPVNESILHVDFLLLDESKEVKMDIPIRINGVAAGVLRGGKLVQRLSKLKVKALPSNLPETLEVDVTNLEVGKSFRVEEIIAKDFIILKTPATPIVSVETTRAMKEKVGA